MRRLTIKGKLIGLFTAAMVAVTTLTGAVAFRNAAQLQARIDGALKEGRMLVLDSVMAAQRKKLEATLFDLLSFDELIQYAKNPTNKNARVVVEGMFISLQSENVIRFSVYDPHFNLLIQMAAEDLPRRAGTLPESLQDVFRKSAREFTNQFYFRGTEGEQQAAPVEFSGMTVIADMDDNPIGFVEIALKPAWVDTMAAIVKCEAALFDPPSGAFVYSSAPALYQHIDRQLADRALGVDAVVTREKSTYQHSSLLPLKAPDGRTLAQLWLTRDCTGDILEQRKNLFLGGAALLLALGLSVGAALYMLKRNVMQPITHTIDGLNASTQHISSASAKMATTSQTLADGATRQAASLQQSSASLEEIASMTRKNAENSSRADQMVNDAHAVVRDAQKTDRKSTRLNSSHYS